jgi:uncharacterized protein YbaR (Trm112 family)
VTVEGETVSLDPQLLEILACPDTHHTPLDYDEAGQTLSCPECGRIFQIRDGIPVLLLDESVPAEPGTVPAEPGAVPAEPGAVPSPSASQDSPGHAQEGVNDAA